MFVFFVPPPPTLKGAVNETNGQRRMAVIRWEEDTKYNKLEPPVKQGKCIENELVRPGVCGRGECSHIVQRAQGRAEGGWEPIQRMHACTHHNPHP